MIHYATAVSSLYTPGSVAVVGASDDTRKWGNWLARGALRGAHRRPVAFVNARGGTVLGQAAHRSLAELPGAAELAVIVVPAAAAFAAVDDALAAGARALVVITSFAGALAERRALDAELAARARDAGALLLGPNCLGVFDAASDLELVPAELPRGAIGLVSQSGNLGLELGRLAQARGLGFSRFVSLGNQAGVDGAAALRALLDHEPTRLIGLYLEDLSDREALVAAAAAATAAGKAVLLLAPDRSAATARLAAAHTGSTPAARAELESLCRAAGIQRVADPAELIELAATLLGGGAPARAGHRAARGPVAPADPVAPAGPVASAGPVPARAGPVAPAGPATIGLPATRKPAESRIAVLADGGGHAALATTLAERLGLRLPRFSERLAMQLRDSLAVTATVENPIDLAGSGEQDIRSFDRTAAAVMRSGEVDGLLVAGCFGGYGDYSERFAEDEVLGARELAEAAAATGLPLTVHTMYPQSPAAEVLRARGVFVSGSIRQAVVTLADALQAA